MLLPLAILVLIDLLNNKIITRSDVEKRTRLPIMGQIGHSEKKDTEIRYSTIQSL
ncbi:MAG: hypothetical protein HC896_10590 [Bacteroidales bacterium]|nr:hypothetical protein [Bacteroidales bacterium]